MQSASIIMNNTIQEIYCDESGATGNNLLNNEQPFFTYASVAVNDNEATNCVEQVIKDYKIQGDELKGLNLLKFNKGRQAIKYILQKYQNQLKVAVFHKKFNLACKLYEHIFEPTIGANNTLFYNLGFHKFISNLLYLEFQQRGEYAEEIFADFENLMKTKDEKQTNYLFSSLFLPNISPILNIIRTFCICHRDTINQELNSLQDTGVGKWVLDLTHSALFSILAEWGQEFYQLNVFCDVAKPLQQYQGLLNVMIDQKDKLFMQLSGEQHPISFNLSSSIELVDSKNYPGIQIADVAAAACAFCYNKPFDKNAAEFKEYLPKIISPYSVIPELEDLNLDTLNAQRNFLLLEELVARSLNKEPLLEGIQEFIINATHYLYQNTD